MDVGDLKILLKSIKKLQNSNLIAGSPNNNLDNDDGGESSTSFTSSTMSLTWNNTPRSTISSASVASIIGRCPPPNLMMSTAGPVSGAAGCTPTSTRYTTTPTHYAHNMSTSRPGVHSRRSVDTTSSGRSEMGDQYSGILFQDAPLMERRDKAVALAAEIQSNTDVTTLLMFVGHLVELQMIMRDGDGYVLPALNTRFMDAQVSKDGSELRASIALTVEYYNLSNAMWEPFIESFALSATSIVQLPPDEVEKAIIDAKIAASGELDTSNQNALQVANSEMPINRAINMITIRAQDSLRINFTHAAISTTPRLLEGITAAFNELSMKNSDAPAASSADNSVDNDVTGSLKDNKVVGDEAARSKNVEVGDSRAMDRDIVSGMGGPSKKVFSQYRLENCTGVPLWYWIDVKEGEARNSRMFLVPQNTSTSIVKPKNDGSSTFLQWKDNTVINVHIDGYMDLLKLPLDQSGSSMRHLKPEKGTLSIPSAIEWDIKTKEGSKFITIKSLLQIQNNVGETVEVKINSKRSTKPEQFFLKTGETYYLPVNYSSRCHMTVRSASEVAYDWGYKPGMQKLLSRGGFPSSSSMSGPGHDVTSSKSVRNRASSAPPTATATATATDDVDTSFGSSANTAYDTSDETLKKKKSPQQRKHGSVPAPVLLKQIKLLAERDVIRAVKDDVDSSDETTSVSGVPPIPSNKPVGLLTTIKMKSTGVSDPPPDAIRNTSMSPRNIRVSSLDDFIENDTKMKQSTSVSQAALSPAPFSKINPAATTAAAKAPRHKSLFTTPSVIISSRSFVAEETQLLRCELNRDKGVPLLEPPLLHYYLVGIQGKFKNQLKVSIQAPAVLQNLLPNKIEYRLGLCLPDRQGKFQPIDSMIQLIGEGILDVGEKSVLLQVHSSENIFISVKMNGYRWSSWETLLWHQQGQKKQFEKKPLVGETNKKTLKLMDFADAIIELRYNVTMNVGGSCDLVIYCPYWMINCCDGIPLQYGMKNEFTGDILPISGQNTAFVEELFENERVVPFQGWRPSNGFGTRAHWSSREGTALTKDDIRLPSSEHWDWDDTWKVDGDFGDASGWEYAFTWEAKEWSVSPKLRQVRRRRWIRPRSPKSSSQLTLYGPPEDYDKIYIRIGDSNWSDAVPLKAALAAGTLTVRDRKKSRHLAKRKTGEAFSPDRYVQSRYELSVYVEPQLSLARGAFYRTNSIYISPRYILVNRIKHHLYITQYGTKISTKLKPLVQIPLHWTDDSAQTLITIERRGCYRSGAFSINTVGRFSVSLRSKFDDSYTNVGVEVKDPLRGVVCIIFTEENTPLYKIVNYSMDTVEFKQVYTKPENWPSRTLLQGESSPFAWAEMALTPKLLKLVIGGQEIKVDIDDLSSSSTVDFGDHVSSSGKKFRRSPNVKRKLPVSSHQSTRIGNDFASNKLEDKEAMVARRIPLYYNEFTMIRSYYDSAKWVARRQYKDNNVVWLSGRSHTDLNLITFEPLCVGKLTSRRTDVVVDDEFSTLERARGASNTSNTSNDSMRSYGEIDSGVSSMASSSVSTGTSTDGYNNNTIKKTAPGPVLKPVYFGDLVHIHSQIPSAGTCYLVEQKEELRWEPVASADEAFELFGDRAVFKINCDSGQLESVVGTPVYHGMNFTFSSTAHRGFRVSTMSHETGQQLDLNVMNYGAGADTLINTVPLHLLRKTSYRTYIYLEVESSTKVLYISTSAHHDALGRLQREGGMSHYKSSLAMRSLYTNRNKFSKLEHRSTRHKRRLSLASRGALNNESQRNLIDLEDRFTTSSSTQNLSPGLRPDRNVKGQGAGKSFSADMNATSDLDTSPATMRKRAHAVSTKEGIPAIHRDIAAAVKRLSRRESVYLGVSELTKPKDLDPLKDIEIIIPSICIALFDEHPSELLHLTLQGISLNFTDTGEDLIKDIVVYRIQLDNQLSGGFEVIMQPTPPPPQLNSETKPFLQILIVKHKTSGSNIDHYRHFSVLVQELEFYIEEHLMHRLYLFAVSLLQFGQFSTAPEDLVEPTSDVIKKFLRKRQNGISPGGGLTKLTNMLESTDDVNVVYYEHLEFHSARINLSFNRSPISAKSQNNAVNDNTMSKAFDALGVVLSTVDRAPIRLNTLEMHHVFATRGVAMVRILDHYKGVALRQGMKILGHVDFLGNPISVISSLGTGLKDFFVEPRNALMTNPRQFHKGLGRGTASLLRNVTRGAATFTSTLTGTASNALTLLSLDQSYIDRKKREKFVRPKNLGQGVVQGMKGFTRGVFDGVTGIVIQPVKGASKAGMRGFAKGFGKGLVGAVVKPGAGILDLIHKPLSGMKEMTDAVRINNRRVRPARLLRGIGRVLYPISVEETIVQRALQSTELDMVPYEEYLYHFIIPHTGYFILFTNRRVVFLESPILGPIEEYRGDDEDVDIMYQQETNLIWEFSLVQDGIGREETVDKETSVEIYLRLERGVLRGGYTGLSGEVDVTLLENFKSHLATVGTHEEPFSMTPIQQRCTWATAVKILKGMNEKMAPTSNVNIVTATIREAEVTYVALTNNSTKMNERELLHLLMYLICVAQVRHPVLLMHLMLCPQLQNSRRLDGEKGRAVTLFCGAVKALARYCQRRVVGT